MSVPTAYPGDLSGLEFGAESYHPASERVAKEHEEKRGRKRPTHSCMLRSLTPRPAALPRRRPLRRGGEAVAGAAGCRFDLVSHLKLPRPAEPRTLPERCTTRAKPNLRSFDLEESVKDAAQDGDMDVFILSIVIFRRRGFEASSGSARLNPAPYLSAA